jgi:hypothetical protein
LAISTVVVGIGLFLTKDMVGVDLTIGRVAAIAFFYILLAEGTYDALDQRWG